VLRWSVVVVAVGAVLGSVTAWAAAPVARPAARAVPALGAVQLVARDGRALPGRWQAYADASLVPTVPGRVKVLLTGCPAMPRAAGCVYTRRPRVVYLRAGLRDPRGVLLHELGHLYDLRVLNQRDRRRFRRIMHRPAGVRWWRGSRAPAEHFAEAYSWCARYASIVSIARYSSYGYRPTARQHHAICALIRRAAADRAPSVPAVAPPLVTAPHALPPPPPSAEPGVVPGDPERDPGPREPEDPDAPPPAPGTPAPPPGLPPLPAPPPLPGAP
jgi:hypothetical protein